MGICRGRRSTCSRKSRCQNEARCGILNVITSPDSTASVPGLTNELQAELFCNNLRRYLSGAPLTNELDKKLLY